MRRGHRVGCSCRWCRWTHRLSSPRPAGPSEPKATIDVATALVLLRNPYLLAASLRLGAREQLAAIANTLQALEGECALLRGELAAQRLLERDW
jgi:hypothetical protein